MKSNMKKSLFLPLMLACHICLAQSWDLLIGSPEDEMAAGAIENSFGNYLVCGCIGSDITWEYDGYVAEISPTGALLNEKRFSNPLNMLCFTDIIEISGGYLVFGYGFEDSTFAPNVLSTVVKKLDYDLNELWSKYYKTDSCSGMVRNTKRMDDGTFASIGICTGVGNTKEVLFYRFDQNGDTLDAKLLNSGAPLPYEWGWDVLDNGGSGYKIFTENYPDTVSVGTTWNVANLDSNLNLISFKSLSEGTFPATLASFFEDPFSAKWLNDSVYMVAGRVYWNDTLPFSNSEFEIGLVFYSLDDSVLSYHRFGKVDSNDVPAHYQAVDFVYRNAIYVGGSSVNPPGNALNLLKLDSTGALLWQKYYGQDYHTPMHVLATQDSGCLLASYIDNGYDRDIYIIKVGPDGEYVPGVPTNELPRETFTIYPNPARDYFTIRSNFNLPASVELYNITGSLVNRQPVTSNLQQVSVQGLSPGLYVYRLVSKEREARGKIIIE